MQTALPKRIIAVLVFVSISAAVMASGRDEGDPTPITWFNNSEYPVVPADKCRVARTLEERLGIELTLKGGTRGSTEVSEQLYLAMLQGGELPDIFPWHHTLISAYPPINELYAPITIEQIRAHMPNIYKALEDAQMRKRPGAEDVWDSTTVNDVIYGIPKLSADYSYLPGILWRKDILDELNLPVPETVSEWEEVFEAYTARYPGKSCWGGIDGSGYVFETIFQATGVYQGGFVRLDEGIAPAIHLPELVDVIEVLRRWYQRGYIKVYSQVDDDNNYVPDTDRYFIKGDMIVTDNAWAKRGDLICEEPYFPHSLPDETSRMNSGAQFVPGPYPRFDSVSGGFGVTSPGEPMVSGFFGFSKALADEPGKIEKIMELADTVAGAESAYLLTQFGIENADWQWQSIAGQSMPVRLDPNDRSANIGTYWLQSYSEFSDRYGAHPRIQANIEEIYYLPGGIYNIQAMIASSTSWETPNDFVGFGVPYSDQTEQAVEQKRMFEERMQKLHILFYREYYIPILKGNRPVSDLEEYRSRYWEEGGIELSNIITQWAP